MTPPVSLALWASGALPRVEIKARLDLLSSPHSAPDSPPAPPLVPILLLPPALSSPFCLKIFSSNSSQFSIMPPSPPFCSCSSAFPNSVPAPTPSSPVPPNPCTPPAPTPMLFVGFAQDSVERKILQRSKPSV